MRTGLWPFAPQIKREITDEDIETLLKIPIRRISRYDINRAQKEMKEIRARLRQIEKHLDGIIPYTIAFLQDLIDRYRSQFPRRTEIVEIERVDVRSAANRNLKLRYDKKTGYLGHQISGTTLCDVSLYDAVLAIRQGRHLLGCPRAGQAIRRQGHALLRLDRQRPNFHRRL